MKKIVALALAVMLASCSTVPQPVPAPAPPPPEPVGSGPKVCKGVYVPGEGCKKLAAGDSGTTVRGYKQDNEEEQPQ